MRCKVKFTANDITYRGISSDFSLNGLFIRTLHAFPPDTLFHIVIYYPNGLISQIKGTVTRALKIPEEEVTKTHRYVQNGIGVKIIEKDANDLHFIRSLLR
ncbi:MAG: PilZ domain-containing protein [Nitrospirae bacterium]|nr:PilZ domain-containing protein [Nitrospirota bacterium]